MVLWILLILILGSLIYLLFAPLILSIDTLYNEYFVRIKGLLKAMVKPHEEEVIVVSLTVLFFKFNLYPLQSRKKKSKKRVGKIPEKKVAGKRQIPYRRLLRMLRSFKVKKLRVELDTRDPVLNAKLYPLFALLNFSVGNFGINFMNKNRLVVKIENRPIYLIKSFMNL